MNGVDLLTEHDITYFYLCLYWITNFCNGTHMAYKDGETFTTYCDKHYDRHDYKIALTNGKSVTFESYDQMKYHWYQWKASCSHVEVIDTKLRAKGF